MRNRSRRRRFLAALAGVGAATLAGCAGMTTVTPSPTKPADWTPTPTPPEPQTYYVGMTAVFAEPRRPFHHDPDEVGGEKRAVDAERGKIPDVQREVGPGVKVTLRNDWGDEDDYGFYGPIDERAVEDACRRAGISRVKTDWDFVGDTRDAVARLNRRLAVLRSAAVSVPAVQAVDTGSPHLLYGSDVPRDAIERTNDRLGRMGLVMLSAGAPSRGQLRAVAPGPRPWTGRRSPSR